MINTPVKTRLDPCANGPAEVSISKVQTMAKAELQGLEELPTNCDSSIALLPQQTTRNGVGIDLMRGGAKRRRGKNEHSLL